MDLRDLGVAGQGQHQRMFAATGADHQHPKRFRHVTEAYADDPAGTGPTEARRSTGQTNVSC